MARESIPEGGAEIRWKPEVLFCYWAVRELGYSVTDLARRLGMAQPAVGNAVSRGEQIANE